MIMKFHRLNDKFFAAYNKLVVLDMPAKYALQLKRTGAKVEEEFKRFQDLYKAVVEKYKDPDAEDKGDGSIQLLEDKVEEFNEKMNDLLNQDVDVDIKKIPFSAIEDSNISMQDLIVLEDFIDEEE
jgi:hypothetical protein